MQHEQAKDSFRSTVLRVRVFKFFRRFCSFVIDYISVSG